MIVEIFGVEPWALGVLTSVAFFGFLASSIFGIGGTMVLVPVLMNFVPAAEAVALVSPVMLLNNGVKLHAFRRNIEFKPALAAMATALPVAAIAALLASSVDERWIKIGIATLILAALGLERLRAIQLEHGLKGLAAWGIAIGIASGLCGAAGAPTALGFRGYGLVKESFVGSIAVLSVGLQIAKLPSFVVTGLLTWERVPLCAALSGCAAASVHLGRSVLRGVPTQRFRVLLDVLLIVIALWLLAGTFQEFWHDAAVSRS